MAICKQLAELMGGSIGVNSAEGKGSEFWFTVRLGLQLNVPNRPPVRAELAQVPVLVVDDHASIRESLRLQLTALGMTPAEAADAPSALRFLYQAVDAGHAFQVVVVDRELPGMDGVALCRAIRSDPRLARTGLVMLTSQSEEAKNAAVVKELGLAACLPRPVRQTELRECLVTAITGRAQPKRERETLSVSPAIRPGAWVLLAEDNIINQQVALGVFGKLGVSVDAVASGREALQALADKPYQLVFMDVRMPVMDGLEATRQLRSGADLRLLACRDIPVIALTANAVVGDREQCLAAGMSDYITKPLAPEAVVRMLNKWLPQELDTAVPDAAPELAPAVAVPAAAAGGAGLPVYDRAAFLERLMGDETIAHVVEKAFLGDLPTQIAKLKSHVVQGDLKPVGEMAHMIKGAAANLSAEALRETVAGMEEAAVAGDTTTLQKLLPELEEEWRKLEAAMKGCYPPDISPP